jgi:hypothetical protein
MAQQTTIAAERTPDIFGASRRVGRSRSEFSMSNIERQKKYRQCRKLMNIGERMNSTITRLAQDFDLTEDTVIRELIKFALCNRNWNQTGFPGAEREAA